MDTKTIITIVASIVALVTSILTSYLTWLKSKEIEKLKLKIDLEKEKIKFLFKYETEQFSQYYLCLKEFLALTQKIKDELRFLINSNTLEGERTKILDTLKEEIISQYSKDVVFYQKQNPDIAHELKNKILMAIEILSINNSTSTGVKDLIHQISLDQKSLGAIMDIEIDNMLKSIENNKKYP